MGDAEDFKAEGFAFFREAHEKATVVFMDETQEIPYTAKCFMNSRKTIGYAEADIKDKHEFIFLSKTAKGIVMTMTADKEGPIPLEAPGIHVIYGTPPDTPSDTMLAMHKRAMGSLPPEVDEEFLKKNVPLLPQKSLDAAMILMNQMLAAMGGAEGLMQALGDAMAGAMEGIGKGIGEAMQGLGGPQDGTAPEERPEEPIEEPMETENPAPWEAAPKKAPPKKAAPKKAAPKKAAAKRPAPKKAAPKKKAPAKAKPKAKPKKGKKKR